MQNQRVIVVGSRNRPPQQELDGALAELGDGWKVVSATTSMVPWGAWQTSDINTGSGIVEGACMHLYYATTAVLERITA